MKQEIDTSYHHDDSKGFTDSEPVELSVANLDQVFALPDWSRVDLGEHKFYKFEGPSLSKNRNKPSVFFTTITSPGVDGKCHIINCHIGGAYQDSFRHLRIGSLEDVHVRSCAAVLTREALVFALNFGEWHVG